MSERGGSLYERIGGDETIARLVDGLYDRILADPELAPFFGRTTVAKLRCMQQEFLAAALDGPSSYSGMDLRYAHADRGILGRHFSRFVHHLLESLQGEQIAPEEIDDVIRRIAVYKNDITGESY